jgi:guanine deaminase
MFTSPRQRSARKMMKKAVAQAFLGLRKNHGGPFGAVIARNGEVISKGHNLVLKSHDPTAHAEIVTIRRAAAKLKKFDLSDCEIYSTCEPCPMCLAAIYWAGIRRVHYGCTRKDAEKIGFRDKRLYDLIKKRKSPAVEKIKLERRECLKPFQEWARKKDRVIY